MNFSWPIRIYYEDTDSGGVVYHGKYLNFLERCRTEFLRHRGFEQDRLINDNNMLFVVRSINIDFNKPARFNELLEVTARVSQIKKASLLFEQKIIRSSDQQLLCQASVLVACLTADGFKPRALPAGLREALGVD